MSTRWAAQWTAPSELLSESARRLLIWEIISVFAVSLGINMLHAIVSFIGSITEKQALSEQHVVLNQSAAPGRPWLDLSLPWTSLPRTCLTSGGGSPCSSFPPCKTACSKRYSWSGTC